MYLSFFIGGDTLISAGNKGARLLDLYDRFNKGAVLTKAELAKLYKVGEKTIQRDIDDLRAYLSESSMYSGNVSIDYDPKRRGYVLVHSQYEHLNNQEVLGITKVLLESRAFELEEMKSMLEKLLAESSPESKDLVEDGGETFHRISRRCRFIGCCRLCDLPDTGVYAE